MNRAAAGRSGHTSGRYKKKRRNRLDITQILLIVIGVLAVILIAAIASRGCGGGSAAGGATESDAVQESTVADGAVTVNGVNIYGMTQEEARKAILDSFDWKMKVKYEDKEADVTNLMADKVDQLLEEIYASDLKPGETYEVNTENMIEDAKAEAALIAGNWNMAAKSGGISGYNKETGKFEFSEGTKGLVIDQDKLAQAMVDAIDKKEFDAVLTAETKEVAADSSVQDKYKTMSTYTTTTTSNSNRNENIRLAVAALNGTIVKPGQEFSFNNTTGARTEEKGYKPATAYLNGEVVQEPGGGVCQVSSTLYNAVVFAGLKSTERHAHSYEPSYVTPGEDAAVSYGGPDFKFVNNSEYPLAIKASFSASDRKLTIALYGVPILKEGVKIRMSSEKTGEIDPPSAVYTEDGSLQPGQEVQTKAATPGSRWSTDLVTYENDKEVSREFFHNSSYRGKAAQIKRNSSAHHQRLQRVLTVMAQRQLVQAPVGTHVAQHAAAHLGAQRARIGVLAPFKENLVNLGMTDDDGHIQLAAQRLDGGGIRLFPAHGQHQDRHGKVVMAHVAVQRQRAQEQQAVLPSAHAHADAIARLNHMKVLIRAADASQCCFHISSRGVTPTYTVSALAG